MRGSNLQGGSEARVEAFCKEEDISNLGRVLTTTAPIAGGTHGFYRYPARFHPEVARAIICAFSRKGGWVLDPFMGGGTSIIEALKLGRAVVGNDVNALARFVAEVRTRPLSAMDKRQIRQWAQRAAQELAEGDLTWVPRKDIANLPAEAELFLAGAIELLGNMLPRRRSFARAVLLRLGQSAVDCRRSDIPYRNYLTERLPRLVEEMLSGLDDLVECCRESGTPKNAITGRRLLLHRSTVGLEEDSRLRHVIGRPRLVLTSPPYPGVHILYHRWQYRGRRETPAPYWIANVPDGSGAAYYCGGSRTPTGMRNYFRMIRSAFSSVKRIMHRDGRVVQIVGFSDARSQLPVYLEAMETAGFRDVRSSELDGEPLKRRVANRRWYAELRGDIDTSTEYLLVHRIRP